MKAAMPNLQLNSSASRRTCAQLLVLLCKHSRKRHFFTLYLFKALLDSLVPVQFDQSTAQIRGSLLVMRMLLPLVQQCLDSNTEETEQRMTQKGTVVKVNQPLRITQEQLLQVSRSRWRQLEYINVILMFVFQLYEVILYHLCSSHSTVVTAALEVYLMILKSIVEIDNH